MSEGLALNILVGFLWACVGMVMTGVASSGGSIFAFYGLGCTLVAAIGWVALVDWSVMQDGVPRMAELFFWIGLGGAVNALGQTLMISTMRRGHKAITWGIGQSAMLIPFLASVVIWRESPGTFGWSGMGLLLAALVVMARGRRRDAGEAIDPRWLLMALSTLVLLGSAQALFSVPSHWAGWTDAARLRTPVSLSAAATVHILVMIGTRQTLERRTMKLSVLWTALALAAYVILFRCLDLMSAVGLSGVVFPIGIGTCVVVFACYSRFRLKEEFGLSDIAGIALALAGMTLIALAGKV